MTFSKVHNLIKISPLSRSPFVFVARERILILIRLKSALTTFAGRYTQNNKSCSQLRCPENYKSER